MGKHIVPPVGVTWDPAFNPSGFDLTNNNLTATVSANSFQDKFLIATLGRNTGTFQFEVQLQSTGASTIAGITAGFATNDCTPKQSGTSNPASSTNYLGKLDVGNSQGFFPSNVVYYYYNSTSQGPSSQSPYATADVPDYIECVVNLDTGVVAYYKNGSALPGLTIPVLPAGFTYFPAISGKYVTEVPFTVTGACTAGFKLSQMVHPIGGVPGWAAP